MRRMMFWQNAGVIDGESAPATPHAPPLAVTDGLVAWFMFDEGAGQVIQGYGADGYPIDYILSMHPQPAQDPAWVAGPGLSWSGQAQLTGSGTGLVFPNGARSIIWVGHQHDLGGPQFGIFKFLRPDGVTTQMRIDTGLYPSFGRQVLVGFQNQVTSSLSKLNTSLSVKTIRIKYVGPTYTVQFAGGNGISTPQGCGLGPTNQEYEHINVYHYVSTGVQGELYYLILYNRWIDDTELVSLYNDVYARMIARGILS